MTVPPALRSLRRHFLKQLDAAVERAQKRLLLVEDHSRHVARLALQFGKGAAHDLHDRRHKFMQERLRRVEVHAAVALARRRMLRTT